MEPLKNGSDRSVGGSVSCTTYLQEVFANEVTNVIDIRWEGVAGLIRFIEFWYRPVAAKDGRLLGRQVRRSVLPRYAEVDEVVLRWVGRSRVMFGWMREVTIPFDDARMIRLWIERFRIHHDIQVHAVPGTRQSAIA